MGEYEQALADYTQALELDPEYAMAYNNRGLTYGKIGKYEQALADFNRALELEPEYATAYNTGGTPTTRWASTSRHWRTTPAPSSSTLILPWRTTTGGSPTTKWATTSRRWRTTHKPSSWNPSTTAQQPGEHLRRDGQVRAGTGGLRQRPRAQP